MPDKPSLPPAEKAIENSVKRFRERGIILPTFKELRQPELIPQPILERLKNIGLWGIVFRG